MTNPKALLREIRLANVSRSEAAHLLTTEHGMSGTDAEELLSLSYRGYPGSKPRERLNFNELLSIIHNAGVNNDPSILLDRYRHENLSFGIAVKLLAERFDLSHKESCQLLAGINPPITCPNGNSLRYEIDRDEINKVLDGVKIGDTNILNRHFTSLDRLREILLSAGIEEPFPRWWPPASGDDVLPDPTTSPAPSEQATHPTREQLAKSRRTRLPIADAVALLVQDTDLETPEDAEEWLNNRFENYTSLIVEPGRVDYDKVLERAKNSSARELWIDRNKRHPVPFAARHVAAETGITYTEALEYLRNMICGSLTRYDKNGELLIIYVPQSIPVEEWDDETLLIHVGEFLQILNRGKINHPSGWPSFLKPRTVTPETPELAGTGTVDPDSVPGETPALVGTSDTGTTQKKGQSNAAGESKCKKWLVELMNDSIANNEGKPTGTKKEYLAGAQNTYAVSVRGFKRAWSEAIAETNATQWSSPGRKS